MHLKKRSNSFLYIGKVLLAVSFALFLYGMIVNLKHKFMIFDPENDVVAINDENGKYTSIDNSGKSDTKNNLEKQEGFDIKEKKNDNYSVDEENNIIRDNIKKKYYIDIKYGMETDGYIVDDLSVTNITNSSEIHAALKSLEKVLTLYPDDLFIEINKGGIPLTIYLIKSYSDESVTGATDSNYSYADISISTIYPIEDTFFHESYHYIERYMLKLGLSYNEVTWSNYNPSDFVYGVSNNNLSYKYTYSENSYFVNNYAQTSPEEDRASTFEYMMMSSKASCLNKGNPVWQKAKLMSNTIDAALISVSPDVVEYWERYL